MAPLFTFHSSVFSVGSTLSCPSSRGTWQLRLTSSSWATSVEKPVLSILSSHRNGFQDTPAHRHLRTRKCLAQKVENLHRTGAHPSINLESSLDCNSNSNVRAMQTDYTILLREWRQVKRPVGVVQMQCFWIFPIHGWLDLSMWNPWMQRADCTCFLQNLSPPPPKCQHWLYLSWFPCISILNQC
jgi:hypothetical protein